MPWARLLIAFSNTSFLFYYPALLTMHSFLTDGFIYSALEDSEITGHIDTAITAARISLRIYLCMHGHAPLLVGIYKNCSGC